MTSSAPSNLGQIALALGFAVLIPFTLLILIHYFVVLPRFKRDFLALHSRRVVRIRRALAEISEGNHVQDEASLLAARAYSFSGWVELRADGCMVVAGQVFRPNDDPFEAIARDGSNLPRARISNVSGQVLIESHGETFRVRFTDAREWDVQLVEEE